MNVHVSFQKLYYPLADSFVLFLPYSSETRHRNRHCYFLKLPKLAQKRLRYTSRNKTSYFQFSWTINFRRPQFQSKDRIVFAKDHILSIRTVYFTFDSPFLQVLSLAQVFKLWFQVNNSLTQLICEHVFKLKVTLSC